MTTEKGTTPADPRHCGAPRRQADAPCTRPAGWGTGHPGVGRCKFHGGSLPSVEFKHAREAELAAAQKSVSRFGARLDVHPSQALLELVQWKAAEVAYWQQRVEEVAVDDLTWGTTKVETGRRGGERVHVRTEEAREHIAHRLLREAQRDLADFSAASLRAGVDESLVVVAKSAAVRLLEVIRGALADPRLGLQVGASVVEQVIVDAVRSVVAPPSAQTPKPTPAVLTQEETT